MRETIEVQSTGTPAIDAVFEPAVANKIDVLSNRLVPGSDGSIEHVVLANDQVTIIRSTPFRGRVRVAKNDVFVGGVSCRILLAGLEARVDTVRHLVGGECPVYGAIFVSRKNTAVKHYRGMKIGSPDLVVESLIEGHRSAARFPRLKTLAKELDGIFLPFDKLGNFPT